MRTTTMQEIREIAAVHGIVFGGIVGLFAIVATVQVCASALLT
mgnify:CR=1 FL=1|jgi:hypothetical protein